MDYVESGGEDYYRYYDQDPVLRYSDYAMPAMPPMLIGIPFILNLSHAPEPGVMVGMNSPGVIVAISLGIFFLIYILLAYTSLTRNVLPQKC